MAGVDASAIQQAVEALGAGAVVAIPTDTVYGLAASLDHPVAMEAIYAIKGRDAGKALPLLVDGYERIKTYALDIPDSAAVLARAFWPGALTLVVRASMVVPYAVHRGAATVGLRMPDNAAALAVIAGCGGGLAVTSANLSGRSEAKSAAEVRRTLGDDVGFILDGGPAEGGIPSTVVDLTGPELRILRQGAITRDDLDRALAG